MTFYFYKKLIEGGADIHVPNSEGFPCLHVAVLNGHSTVIQQLIMFGAEIEALDSSGNTALQVSYQTHGQVVNYFSISI